MSHKAQFLILGLTILSLTTKAQTDSVRTNTKPATYENQKEQAAKADVYIVNKSIGIGEANIQTSTEKKSAVTNTKKTYKQKTKKKQSGRKCNNKFAS